MTEDEYRIAIERERRTGRLELLEVADEPWSRRIVELASLAEGWDADSGSGSPVAFVAIELARELLRAAASVGGAPSAGLFPMHDGGVLTEWTTAGRVVSAEISPEGEIYIHNFVLDPRSSSESETADIEVAKAAVVGALS